MSEELKKRIADRAYEIFVERGGVHGNDFEDWVLAEQDVMAEAGTGPHTNADASVAQISPVRAVRPPASAGTIAVRKSR